MQNQVPSVTSSALPHFGDCALRARKPFARRMLLSSNDSRFQTAGYEIKKCDLSSGRMVAENGFVNDRDFSDKMLP